MAKTQVYLNDRITFGRDNISEGNVNEATYVLRKVDAVRLEFTSANLSV